MIIRFFKNGGSFVGAGRYYLHDKAADKTLPAHLKPTTDERVWFTDTRNCISHNPEDALIEMWRTAEDQAWLKKQAGVRSGGRSCDDPVKTFALAWHKDDAPTPEHMVASADAFLKHMGWEGHQAVFIAHRETEHLHLHVILNRVHPETGRTIDDWRENRRAGQWREIYEREQGVIRTAQRGETAKQRKDRAVDTRIDAVDTVRELTSQNPANDHLPHNVIMIARPGEKQFAAEEQARRDADSQHWDLLKRAQREERMEWFNYGRELFKATRHAVYDSVREEFRDEWKDFYKERKAATKEAVRISETAVGRAHWFAERNQWTEARIAFKDHDAVKKEVATTFSLRQAEIKERQTTLLRARQDAAITALRQSRDIEYKELLARQKGERASLRAGELQMGYSLPTAADRARDLVVQTLTQGAANANTDTKSQTADTTLATTSTPTDTQATSIEGNQHRVPLQPLDPALTTAPRATANLYTDHTFTLPAPDLLSRSAVPLAATAHMLERLPTSNNTDIALVGLALHHEYGGHDAARELFSQWSSRHPAWRGASAETIWSTIDPDRSDATGLPMLIAVARAHGVDTKPLTDVPDPFPEATSPRDARLTPSDTYASPNPLVQEPIKSSSDLAAGAIGKLADYLADQLGEALAPTPPEIREARARAEARREAERPQPEEDPARARARNVEGQVRAAEQVRQQQQDRDWWTERDRSRDRDR